MQKKTISKPNSVISGSSFSLPVSYYEKTTPYPFDDFDDEDNDFDGEIKGFDDFGEGILGLETNDDTESNEFKDIVQAFNPYVKIPRPKYEPSPSSIFKFIKK